MKRSARTRRRSIGGLTLLALLLSPLVVFGQDLAALYTQINAAYRAEDYSTVIDLYERAKLDHEAHRDSQYLPVIWWHYAIALHDAERYCDAHREYTAMVEQGLPKRVKKLASRLEHRKIRLGPSLKGTLVVRCADLNIESTIDGKTKTGCDARFEQLVPGGHSITVSLDGVAYPTQRADVTPCVVTDVKLPSLGTVRWTGAPASTDVLLGGQSLGTAAKATRLPPGEFEMELKAPGFTPRTRTVKIESGRDLELAYNVGPPTPVAPWIALGTSATIAAIGGYFFFQHLSDADAQESAQAAYLAESQSLARAGVLRADLIAAKEAADDSGTKALVFGGIGAAGLIGSAVWLWAASEDEAPPSAGLHFDGRTVMFGGTW